MSLDLTGIGSVADFAKGLVDRFLPAKATETEKAQTQIQLQEIIGKREGAIEETVRAEMKAKKDIIVAELNQGDLYTKRARPSIVYAGLGFIALNHVVSPTAAIFTEVAVPNLNLPAEFWYAWTAICMTYAVGRSAEKKGVKNKVISAITGT